MGGGQLMIRGMNTNHTLLLWNGRRLADEDMSVSAGGMALERLPWFSADRIEIIRGPSSAVYGSDAMGGVINFIEKESETPLFEAGALTSSEKETSYFQWGSGRQGPWNFSLKGAIGRTRPIQYKRSSALYTPEYGPERTMETDVSYRLSDRNTLTGGYLLEEDHHHLRMPLKYTMHRHSQNFWITDEGKAGSHQFRWDITRSHLEKNSNLPYEGKSEYSLTDASARDSVSYQKGVLSYGLEWSETGRKGEDLSRDKNRYAQIKTGEYISFVWNISHKWTLIPAFRGESTSSMAWRGTPDVGAVYRWNDCTRLKMNWGKAYKTPSLGEKYLYMSHATPIGPVYVEGNDHLKNETSESRDISLEFERRLYTGKITYFQNDVKNLIEARFLGGMPFRGMFYRYENIGKARIKGMESEIARNFPSHWSWKISYVYLDAKDGGGARLDYRPRQTVIGSLSYGGTDPYGWSGSLWDAWEQNYRFDNQSYSYQLWNGAVQKHWGPAWTASAGIYNIGSKKIDKLYITGREWMLSVKHRF
jgi:outer membrane receptor for ferrienterochelin and colicins